MFGSLWSILNLGVIQVPRGKSDKKMKIETPASTKLVLPITQKKIKQGIVFPLQEVEFKGQYTQRILQFCAWQNAKINGCVGRDVVCCVHTQSLKIG